LYISCTADLLISAAECDPIWSWEECVLAEVFHEQTEDLAAMWCWTETVEWISRTDFAILKHPTWAIFIFLLLFYSLIHIIQNSLKLAILHYVLHIIGRLRLTSTFHRHISLSV